MSIHRLAFAASVVLGFSSPALAQVAVEGIVPPSADAEVFNLAGLDAFQQNHSARNATYQSVRARFQLPEDSRIGDTVTQSGMFLTSQGKSETVNKPNLWLSFSGRSYFDQYEGYSADLTAGMDWLVGSSSVLGLMIGAGTTDLDDPTFSEAQTSSYLVGGYAAHVFASGVQVDGYLAHAAVDYEVGATEFDTKRTLAGFSVRRDVAVSTGVLQPRLQLSGSWEDFPTGVGGVTGGITEQFIGSIGARHEFNTTFHSRGFTPWASLDIEYGHQEDTTGVIDYFLYPRLGLGLIGNVGQGTLSTSVDVGHVRSDVYAVGVELSYRYSF